MQTAVFINATAASRYMGTVPWFPGRQIHSRPVYEGRALTGYSVVINGVAVTENEVEITQ